MNHFEVISFVFFSCFNANYFNALMLISESTCLPNMWPGFDSWSQRYMWVEFVVGSRHCFEGFSPGTPVFPPPQKTNIFKFQFDLETVERRATSRIPLKFPFILYLFYLLTSYAEREANTGFTIQVAMGRAYYRGDS